MLNKYVREDMYECNYTHYVIYRIAKYVNSTKTRVNDKKNKIRILCVFIYIAYFF